MANKYCSKCGAEMPEGAMFCTKCGKPIDEGTAIQSKREHKVNKKTVYALLGTLGALFLIVLGAMFYSEYSEAREERLAREKFVADSLEKARKDSLRRIELAEQQRADSLFRQESKHFVESFYTVLLKRNGNDKIIEQSITLHAKKILIQLYRDCWGGDENFMATWVFTKEYHDSPISDVYSFRVSEQEKGQYLVSIRYEYSETEYSEYDVLLTIVKEENTYKIDNVEKKRVFYNMKTSEDEDYYG